MKKNVINFVTNNIIEMNNEKIFNFAFFIKKSKIVKFETSSNISFNQKKFQFTSEKHQFQIVLARKSPQKNRPC